MVRPSPGHAFEERRVPLERLLQGRRGDELGQAVHPVGERVAGPQRPEATNSSWVTRPSRSASLAKSWSVCHFETSSFQYGTVQPRFSYSPAGPGSSITPSSGRYSAATILLIETPFRFAGHGQPHTTRAASVG